MNRKHFLQSLGLGTAAMVTPSLAASSLQIENAARGAVRITDVKTYLFKKACFVKIETDAGISGWGESDGANKKFTPLYIEQALKQYVVGKDPFESEGIWHEAYLKGLESGVGGIHPGSLAGIDNALWDLKGKLLNMPVHKLLGSNGKDRIQVYGSYGRDRGKAGYRTPLEMAKIAEGFVEKGYKAVKARLQIRQENVNPFPDDTEAYVKEIRQAIGDETLLFIDFNNGYTPAQATVMGRLLAEKYNVAALEEPVFQQDYAGLKQVVDALDIPVMGGEHEYNLWMMKDLIVTGGVDLINADVIKCGGITECKKVAALAHAFGKQLMLHNAKPTLATAASLQLLASIPNAARFQEYAGKRIEDGYGKLYPLFDNYVEFKDGYLYLTDEPGLGLIVNEKKMEEGKR
ncbi:MAG: mandelate racemase/muconate lactonizing enzyme family protein [Bacteroidota bacterium]